MTRINSGPPLYEFLPLDRHSDYGFGAIAESYLDSAKLLNKSTELITTTDTLPLLFLLRHSSELFLKSGIIMMHKALNIDFENESCDSIPKIIANNKWIPLYGVHKLSLLFCHYERILLDNLEFLCSNTHTRWERPSAEFYESIKVATEYDNRSDFFRYPISRDAGRDVLKSSSKSFDEQEFLAHIKNLGKEEEEYVKALLAEDSSKNSEVFVWGINQLSELRKSLLKVAEDLSLYHFIMKCELTGGC